MNTISAFSNTLYATQNDLLKTDKSTSQSANFKLLADFEPIKSIKNTADGGMLLEWFVPNASQNYFSSLENGINLGFVSEDEFKKSLSYLSNLMKEVANFVKAEQGQSQLALDLHLMQGGDLLDEYYKMEEFIAQSALISPDIEVANGIYTVTQSFFDFVADKIVGLPKDEIVKNLNIIKSYIQNKTQPRDIINAQKAQYTQNMLENLKQKLDKDLGGENLLKRFLGEI